MNTQTHVLLAIAAVVPLVHGPLLSEASTRRVRLLVAAAVIGGLLPDASLVVMILTGMAQQVPTNVIFDQWYFSDLWQRLAAMSNSIPIFALVSIASLWLLRRYSSKTEQHVRQTTCNSAELVFVLSTSSLIHALTDLPLHHNDGRPHFWPLTNWVYASPVSYWDPRHHGDLWSIIETMIMVVLAVVLWRRYVSALARSFIAIAALSLLAVTGMWTWIFS